jgi:hypothetical protein
VPYSPLLVALETEQPLRRHRFAVPDDPDEEIGLALERSRDVLAVRVENRLPHALPTGSFGRREVKLFASWPGGARELPVAARPGAALAAGEARAVTLPLDAAARRQPIAVSLRRYDPAARAWQELARAESPPPEHREDRDVPRSRLRDAAHAAARRMKKPFMLPSASP